VQDVVAQVSLRPAAGSGKQGMSLPASEHLLSMPFASPMLQHLDRLSFLQHRELQEPQLADKREKVVYYRIANHYK
jgi:hypothetical protein